MEGQRAFAVRYMNGDVDWIPSSEAADPDILSEHTLVWHPPCFRSLSKSSSRRQESSLSRHSILCSGRYSSVASGLCGSSSSSMPPLCRETVRGWQGHRACGVGSSLNGICDGVPPSRWSKGWFCEFHICSLCKVLYERCSFCCRWTGLPACATAEATELCGRSQVVLGDLAREYDETWRVPIERLPLHLQREFGSFCGGENRHGDSATQPLSCWFKIMVRRALCEDPPGEQRLPPRLPTPPASDSEEELEYFVYVPCGNLIFEATNP